MKKFFKKTEGFTLVELIVVIAILGILAGVGTVGYSGYIKKAQIAADEQLLATINQAFSAACVENGIDQKSVTSASITLTDKKVQSGVTVNPVGTVDATEAVKIELAFDKYYAGNESNAFKTITASSLAYLPGMGFCMTNEDGTVTVTYNGKPVNVAAEAVAALTNSTFGEMGSATVLGQVGFASNLANVMMESANSSLHNVLTVENLAALMGYDLENEDDDAEFWTVYDEMITELQGTGLSEDEAKRQILANSAVLSVAQASKAKTAEEIETLLASGSLSSTLGAKMDDSATAEDALAEAALAYGMYTSYTYGTTGKMPNITNLGELTSVLNDEGFKTYISSTEGQEDLDAYIAALGVVNSGVEQGAATDVLTDGYANAEMLALLQQVMGK